MIPNPPPSLAPTPANSVEAAGCGNGPIPTDATNFGLLLRQQMQGPAPAASLPGDSQVAEDVGKPQTATAVNEPAEISSIATLLAIPLTAPLTTNIAVATAPQLTLSSSAGAFATAATAQAGDLISQVSDSFPRSSEQSLAPVDFSPPPSQWPVLGKVENPLAQFSGRSPETSPQLLAASRFTVDPATLPQATALAATPLLPPQVAQIANVAEHINSPIGTREWQGELGQKVTWMVADRQQVAELHLNPPDLGPLQVVLSVSEGEASALFVSHHGAVREAIESAMPRLREMMAQNGVNLGSVTVSADAFPRQSSGSAYERQAPAGARTDLASDQPEAAFLPVRRAGSGLVDTFA